MSVRTYNPSVRVGNWNEDIQLEEDTLKDFLARKERGELLIQQSAALSQDAHCKIDLSVSRDGNVHFGDVVMLVNGAPKDNSRPPAVLSCGVKDVKDKAANVTATTNVAPTSRTAFRITSVDDSPEGVSLKYAQPFSLTSVSGNQSLCSDRATFYNFAKKSRHDAVTLDNPCNPIQAQWNVKAFNPQIRMELEYTDVPANKPIIIAHQKTNQSLCLECDHTMRTPFGMEYEVSGFTKLNSHKAEENVNHWTIQCIVPGDPNSPQ